MPSSDTSLMARATSVFTFLAGLALLGMLLVSGGDIIGRTLFSLPIEGSTSIISELLFPMVVFFSLPMLASKAAHIRVDLMDRYLSRWDRPKAVLFGVLMALFWAAIAWMAGGRAYEAFLLNQRPIGAVGIPAAWSYGIVSLGAGFATIAHLFWMFTKPSGDTH